MKKSIDKAEKTEYNGIEVILGDVCYPKSEALIIPANSKGIMNRDLPSNIIKDGFAGISKEVKAIVSNNNIEVGQCFSTGAGRLKRRGLKKIYHTVIKRLQSDFTSLYIVNNALNNVLGTVVRDKMKSVAVCGLGIDDGNLDKKSVARITVEICKRYSKKIKIKIIDSNEEFIREVSNLVKE